MKEIFYIFYLQYVLFFANISMLRKFPAVIFAIRSDNMAYKEVSRWLNVKFVARAFISETT